ncbi:MAG: hypothetical protein RR540_01010, partial [Oscillospiraceae bacterium]
MEGFSADEPFQTVEDFPPHKAAMGNFSPLRRRAEHFVLRYDPYFSTLCRPRRKIFERVRLRGVFAATSGSCLRRPTLAASKS